MSGEPSLLVITPSRGRPENVARLLAAIHSTARNQVHLHVCVDDDDEMLPAYRAVMDRDGRDGDVLETGPRKGLAAWTNEIAVRRAAEYPFLASFGDDHVPRTAGWDHYLTRAIVNMGGAGFSYPWDGTRTDIPEAVVMSSPIVGALGWMCEPSLEHWYVDTVWADLGRAAGCLRHCRLVVVDHVHPAAGAAPADRTYAESGEKLAADRDAYYSWRRTRMAGDIATVRALVTETVAAA
jgi:hypothetical protein